MAGDQRQAPRLARRPPMDTTWGASALAYIMRLDIEFELGASDQSDAAICRAGKSSIETATHAARCLRLEKTSNSAGHVPDRTRPRSQRRPPSPSVFPQRRRNLLLPSSRSHLLAELSHTCCAVRAGYPAMPPCPPPTRRVRSLSCAHLSWVEEVVGHRAPAARPRSKRARSERLSYCARWRSYHSLSLSALLPSDTDRASHWRRLAMCSRQFCVYRGVSVGLSRVQCGTP